MRKKGIFLLVFLLACCVLAVSACSSGNGQIDVVFNSQGGSEVSACLATKGTKISAPIPPTKLGQVFCGWYLEAACITKWKFDTDTVVAPLTLYAKWQDAPAGDLRITRIAISVPAQKRVFRVGDIFQTDGLVIERVMSDGSHFELLPTEYTIDSSAFQKNFVGNYKIVVALAADPTKTVGYMAEVRELVKVQSIALSAQSAQPTKFLVGDNFSATGLLIEKTYVDGTVEKALSAEYEVIAPAMTVQNASAKVGVTLLGTEEATCSYSVAIYNGAELAPTQINIKTPALKTKFALGDAFSSAGLRVEKTTAELGARKIEMEGTSYTVDFAEFGLGKADANIIVKANGVVGVQCSYRVQVVDTSLKTLQNIRIAQTSAHQTVFYFNEDFNADNLVVEKVMSDETAFVLTSNEYTVDKGSFVANTAGATFAIVVKLVSDPTKTATYAATVVAPAFGGVWYEVEASAGIKNHRVCFEIKADGSMVDPNAPSSAIPYTLTREGGVCQLKTANEQWAFDEATQTLTGGYLLHKVQKGQVYLRFLDGKGSLIGGFYTEADGKLAKPYADFIATFGNWYHTSAGTEAELVAQQNTFTAGATLYAMFAQTNQKGKPFVGEYYQKSGKNKQILFKISDNGMAYLNKQELGCLKVEPMTGGYRFVVQGMVLLYQNSTQLLWEYGTTEPLVRFDPAKDVVVTLTSSGGATSAVGRYAVSRGSAFLTKFERVQDINNPVRFVQLTLEGYNNTPIERDTTFAITTQVEYQERILGERFGVFSKYFVLEKHGALSKFEQTTETKGTYSILSVAVDQLRIQIDVGGQSSSATLASGQSGKVFAIDSGADKGNYLKNNPVFFQSQPFIGQYFNGDDCVQFFPDGGLQVQLGATTASASDVAITSVAQGAIHLSVELYFSVWQKFALVYNLQDNTVVFDGATYRAKTYAGAKFLGRWADSAKTKSIVLYPSGLVEFCASDAVQSTSAIAYCEGDKIVLKNGQTLQYGATTMSITGSTTVYTYQKV